MRRFTLLTLMASFFVASTASALQFSLLSPAEVPYNPGESFTVDIALDNPLALSVFGVIGSVSGLAAAGAEVTAGQSASVHFTGVCSATQCFGGLPTVNNIFYNPNDLPASGAYTPGNDSITIVNALAASATNQTGAADPGLDGGLATPSARDITLTIVAHTIGVHTLTISGAYSDGVDEIPTNSVQLTLTMMVPEPGTALLVGLGLTGLVFAERRE